MRIRLWLCMLFLTCFFLPLPAVSAETSLTVGTAKENLTPPAGTPLSGYGNLRGKPSKGTHDPLYARAIALSNGEQTVLFLSLDLCLIDENLRREIFEKIHASVPAFTSPNLVLFATHTHSGAGAVGKRFWERFIMGKFNRNVFQTLTDRAAAAGIQALQNLAPVKVQAASLPLGELVENRMLPNLRYPQALKVLRFEDPAGTVRGLLLFMAAHPTVFPAKSLHFSADYPGLLASRLESRFPQAGVVFANGAAGDLRPHLIDSEDRIEKMTVFSEALETLVAQASFAPLSLDAPWEIILEHVKLPRVRIRAGWFHVPSFVGNRFFPRKTRFQAVRMGPLAFLTFPGELTSEVGNQIENAVTEKGLTPLLIGYANDYLGYVVPRRYYKNMDQYESRVSFYGREMDWFAIRKMTSLADHLLSNEERRTVNPPGHVEHSDQLPVLYVKGDAYHQGFEEGRLLRQQIRHGMDQIHAYFRSELKVPLVNRLIIRMMGNRAWKQLSPYVSYDEYETIRGIAEGAGVSLGSLKRIHAMPELFPTLCTNGAYWGDATVDGKLLAIRNLDWNRKMGVQSLAAVKYHDQEAGPDYVNIGYAGFAGVLSGLNEEGISVGQIGASSSEETMKGVAMPFLMKRLLENSRSLEDARLVFKRSELTRGYNYVIADAGAREAMVVEATARHLAFFQDDDPAEASAPYAFRLKDAVFRGDPALDPAIRDLQTASGGRPEKPGTEAPSGSAYEIRYLKHGQLVKDQYGRITAETAMEIAREIAPGSNIQSVVYAFPDFYVANAAGDKRAVDSGYAAFNFNDLKKQHAESTRQ